ncbi:MAG: HAD family phosphatase [bacterium]
MNIQGIIFDFDGVILNGVKLHDAVFLENLHEAGIVTTIEELHKTIGGTINACYRKFMSLELAEKLTQSHLVKILKLYQAETDFDRSLLPFLEHLKAQNIKLAVGSGSDYSVVKGALAFHHLDQYFPVIIGGDQVTKGKPDPEVFLKCADQIVIAPEQIVVIEDGRLGLQAAKSAGMNGIGYNYFEDFLGDYQPKFSSFGEIEEWLFEREN